VIIGVLLLIRIAKLCIGVEDWGLFQLMEVENARLVYQKDGCNAIENMMIMPRLGRFYVIAKK